MGTKKGEVLPLSPDRLYQSPQQYPGFPHPDGMGNPIGQVCCSNYGRFAGTRRNKTSYRNRVFVVFSVTNIIK